MCRAVVGEIDEQQDAGLSFETIKGAPLDPVVY
jgi:hypothetical protein